jgi:excisionase family DNA binding protein
LGGVDVETFSFMIRSRAIPPVPNADMNAPAIPRALPSDDDIVLARESGRVLSTVLQTRAETLQVDLHDDNGTVRTVRIPTTALRLLLDVLTEIGQGNAVSIIPIHAELTSQEAADVLNVSRPFLVQLLERGDIPFHKTGTHRRVHYQDVVAYKERIDAQRSVALDELAAQAQDLGLGY